MNTSVKSYKKIWSGLQFNCQKHLATSSHARCRKKDNLGGTQWGLRLRFSSEKAALLDIIISDRQKMSRRTLIKLINDTAAYFDRLISNMISLCSRKNDIPDELWRLQAKTLKTMEYKVQTALGISKEHYQHSTMYPIYGSGQGVGNFARTGYSPAHPWWTHSKKIAKAVQWSVQTAT